MTRSARPLLYSPKFVCACALLFTPLFGAALQARNWDELGEPDEARASRQWVRASLWLLVLYLVVQTIFRNEPFINWFGPYFLVVFWGAWMITGGRRQPGFVARRCGDNFDHRPIGRAMILGAAGWLVWGLLSFTVALGLSLAGIDPMPGEQAPEHGVVIRMPEGADKPVIEELPPPESRTDAAAPAKP